MFSSSIVAILIICAANAFTFRCEVPDMISYSPQVVFTCTFSEEVTINRQDRIFVPNFMSISPTSGMSKIFSITAGVEDNTMGTIALLLGEGAFSAGLTVSPKYSVSTNYDFVHGNVNVVGIIENLSDKPDRAVLVISGGISVLQKVNSIDEIAVFPSCVEVLSIRSTASSYIVELFVKTPSDLSGSLFHINAGVIQSYWGMKTNIEKDVLITVNNIITSTSYTELWSGNTIYVADNSFSYAVSSIEKNGCVVDAASFNGNNVEIVSIIHDVSDTLLNARLIDASIPGSVSFVGFAPNTCTAIDYPTKMTAMIVKEEVPTYTTKYSTATAGCTNVAITFNAPVKMTGSDLLLVTASSETVPSVVASAVNWVTVAYFRGIVAKVCISSDSDTLSVSVNSNTVRTPSGAVIATVDPTTIYVSRQSLVIKMDTMTLPPAYLNNEYVINQETPITLTFRTLGAIDMTKCDFTNAFTSDYLVLLQQTVTVEEIRLTVESRSIDHHVIDIDASKVICDGSFSVEFIPTQIKYAYDPAFKPGDILITRVNSYYSPEFDFVALRKVFNWNKVFFTDAGWVNEVFGFVDHGSDGYISWTPKTDVDAGVMQSWSYVAMTQSLDRTIPREVDIDFSFNYEQHGFLLDFQDNLFVYVTDSWNTVSKYDSPNLTFLFGVYWSSSEWAPQTNNYLDITAEYSSLPHMLENYSVALGIQAVPVPRGVNYMSIKQSIFITFMHSSQHMLELIVDKANWDVSQKDRFPTSPVVSYMERPMDFVMTPSLTESVISFCFDFVTPFTVSWNATKINVEFEGMPVTFTVVQTNGVFCVEFNRLPQEGLVRLSVREGAFWYTTSSTLIHATFNIVPFTYESRLLNTPTFESLFAADKSLQIVTITSSQACASWTMPITGALAALVDQTDNTFRFAFSAQTNSRFMLDTGFCTTFGGIPSAPFVSSTVTAVPIVPTSSFVHRAMFKEMRSNTKSPKTMSVLAPGAGWTLNENAVVSLNGVPAISMSFNSETLELITVFNATMLTEDEQVVVLPGGLFVNGPACSVFHTVSFGFSQTPVDVLANTIFPWSSIISESVNQASFKTAFRPVSGSKNPMELIQLSGMCQSIGYMMGPAVGPFVSIAVMDGTCNYGVAAASTFDSYGNTNTEANVTIEFDFLPPQGKVALVEDHTSSFPTGNLRFYWNRNPVVAVFFDESLLNFDETQKLIDVDRCSILSVSQAVEEKKTVLRYTLVNCLEGPVSVTLINDVIFSDLSHNKIMSQSSITGFPLSFDYDVTVPTVSINSSVTTLFVDNINVSYTISEPHTSFSCASIGIAVEDVTVTVTEMDNNVCHYVFTPKPINGTHILFFVPAGRFHDRALNGNTASNTLSPFVFNAGAQITPHIDRYTNSQRIQFSLDIAYTWLCPSYENIFPSTMQSDNDIVQIEKEGRSVIVDGIATQTFSLTFVNLQKFPEDRFKNISIQIPSHVCVHPNGIYNDAVTFYVSYYKSPTKPSFDAHLKTTPDDIFGMTVSFSDVKAFGPEEASHYVRVSMTRSRSAVFCNTTRSLVEAVYSYYVQCPEMEEGDLSITMLEGAVIELVNTPSSEFTHVVHVDGSRPTVTLSHNSGSTFGPNVSSLPVTVKISEVMQQMSLDCFQFENIEGLTVSVQLPTSASSNVATLTMVNNELSEGRVSGSFGMYIKEKCTYDSFKNWNMKSNVLTFSYDFVVPTVTITCPAQSTILNTYTIEGTFSEPCQHLTSHNVPVHASCFVREIVQNDDIHFGITISCTQNGTFSFGIQKFVDMVGNVGGISNLCSADFTIFGPTIKYSVDNLIDNQYINTRVFKINISAEPHCAHIDLTAANMFSVVNSNDAMATMISACSWTITGTNTKEGLVSVHIGEGAAVDVYGGTSMSSLIMFRSYQSKPTVMTVIPQVFPAGATNDVTVCYNYNVVRGLGEAAVSSGCSSVVVKSISQNCVVLTVAFDVVDQCNVLLNENFVKTMWELGSVSRYLTLTIDNSRPAFNLTIVAGEKTITDSVSSVEASEYAVSLNANFVLSLSVPQNVNVDMKMLQYTPSECAESVEVSRGEDVTVSVVFKNVETCVVLVTLNKGFYTDAFRRQSETLQMQFSYQNKPLTVVVDMNQFSKEAPVEACCSFSAHTILKAENVETTVPVAVQKTEKCDNLISFSPVTDGVFAFNLIDVKDEFGNDLTDFVPMEFVFYGMELAPITDIDPAVTSTKAGVLTSTMTIRFNHLMADVPSDIDELFVLAVQSNMKLSDYFMANATTINNEVMIVITPLSTEEGLFEFSVELSPLAFVDVAGNTVTKVTTYLILDNQTPTIESITVNGASFFSKLPVTITILFSEPVHFVENYYELVTGSLNGVNITFTGESMTDYVTEVKLVSVNANVELAAGDNLIVDVAAGIAMDSTKLIVENAFSSVLTATNGVMRMTEASVVSGNSPSVTLVFTTPVMHVMTDKIMFTNGEIGSIDFTASGLVLHIKCASEGKWSVRMLPGAIVGTDDSETSDVLFYDGMYDSIKPILACTLPTAIAADIVSISCSLSEPITVLGEIFRVIHEDLLLSHNETISEDKTIVTMDFFAINTCITDYTSTVILELDEENCVDFSGNHCEMAVYEIPVDCVLVTPTLRASHIYVKSDEVTTILLNFDKEIVTPINETAIEVTYNDEVASYRMVNFATLVEGLRYAVEIVFTSSQHLDELIAFTVTVPMGVTEDVLGNLNRETSISIYINEIPPVFSADIIPNSDFIRVDLCAQNGPVSYLSADQLQLSDNIENIAIELVETKETTSCYTLSVVLNCVQSCLFKITVLAEKVFDDAGNQLAEDFVISGMAVMLPVVKMSRDSMFCAETNCVFTISISESASFNCDIIQVDNDNFAAVSKDCTNTMSCDCTVMVVNANDFVDAVTVTIPAGNITTSYDASNEESVSLVLLQSSVSPVALLQTNWTVTDSIFDIPFNMLISTPCNAVPASIVQCDQCEIQNWRAVSSGIVGEYTFTVSFLSDIGRYARIYINGDSFTDLFGRKNTPSEYVLRLNAVAPSVQHFLFTADTEWPITMQFDARMHSCSGQIRIIPQDALSFTQTIDADNVNLVKFQGKDVMLKSVLLSDSVYTVEWDATAFCDATNLPSSTVCNSCGFNTTAGVPTPPTSVFVSEITDRSVRITYSGVRSSSDSLHAILAIMSPSNLNTNPFEFRTAALEESFVVTGLESNTFYHLSLQAKNGYGVSLGSPDVEFTTVAGTPLPATQLRVCDVINAENHNNVITYSRAKACWTASRSRFVSYKLTLTVLDTTSEEDYMITQYESDEASAEFDVPKGVTRYMLTVSTISTLLVASGANFTDVSAEFVTSINLEDVSAFPQGAGMTVRVERLGEKAASISFTHPLENYFRIERYLVQYGNIFNVTFSPEEAVHGIYPFDFNHCLGNSVVLTMRVGIRDNFWGVPSKAVTVSCKKPKLQILATPSETHVTFYVLGDTALDLTCDILSSTSELCGSQRIFLDPVVTTYPIYLFNSLLMETEYTIVCSGVDMDHNVISARTYVSTSAGSQVPAVMVDDVNEDTMQMNFAEIPVQSVTVPGTVHCVAQEALHVLPLSHSQFIKSEFKTYVFPEMTDMLVTISHLKPATTYVARCMLDPDFAPTFGVGSRRLVDKEIRFTTTTTSSPKWLSVSPAGSVTVRLDATIVLKARMPVVANHGSIILKCLSNPQLSQTHSVTGANVIVKGNIVMLKPFPLVSGQEYVIQTSSIGVFVDADTSASLPMLYDNTYAFTVTTDRRMTAIPSVVATVPGNNTISDVVDMTVSVIFNQAIAIAAGGYSIKVGDTPVQQMGQVGLTVVGMSLRIHSGLFYPAGKEVVVTLQKGLICSAYGACTTEKIIMQFTVGSHDFEPSLLTLSPANEAKHIPAGEDIVMTFNKEVQIIDSCVFTFTNELGAAIMLPYGPEKIRVSPRVVVESNVVRVRGSLLPGGHIYSTMFDATCFRDSQDRSARNLPSVYSVGYSEYSCSGNYINQDMYNECKCFLTTAKCECWCGEPETPTDVVIRLML